MSLARAGDRTAWSELVRQFEPRIFALALQIAGNRSDAEDIVQETFLRAYRSLGAFRGVCSWKSWVYRIALNRALSHRRRAGLRGARVTQDDDRVRAAVAVDAEGDPAAAAELAERYALLLSALDQLSPPLKAAVVLVAIQGLTHVEAAAIEGVSPGTISWRIHEARRQLTRALTPVSEVRRKRQPSPPQPARRKC